MKINLTALLISIIFLVHTIPVYSQIDYTDFDLLLQKIVSGNSVNYIQLLEEQESLLSFTDMLSEISPDSHPDQFKNEDEKLAYWINAYNAFILKLVMENYPVESIKDIKFIGFTVWLHKNSIGGEEISFKSLEDDIIREKFQDPRIHFAINCASFSCPPLINRAYLPAKLENQLNESTKSFINDGNNFRIDESRNTIYLSSIFDWYEDDFLDWLNKNKNIEEPHLLDYIKHYYSGQITDILYTFDIEFFDYDWQLNEILKVSSDF